MLDGSVEVDRRHSLVDASRKQMGSALAEHGMQIPSREEMNDREVTRLCCDLVRKDTELRTYEQEFRRAVQKVALIFVPLYGLLVVLFLTIAPMDAALITAGAASIVASIPICLSVSFGFPERPEWLHAIYGIESPRHWRKTHRSRLLSRIADELTKEYS